MEYIVNLRTLFANVDKTRLAMLENRDDQGELFFDDPHKHAIDEFSAAYSPRKWPRAQREFADVMREYENCQRNDDKVSDRYLTLLGDLLRAIAIDPPKRIHRDPPKEMAANGIDLVQIAYEWRWLLPDGNPDVDRVAREIVKPGSELTEAEIEKRWLFDLCELGFVWVEPPEPDAETEAGGNLEPVKAVAPVETGPASLDSLVQSKCSIEQAAAIKASQYGGTVQEWSRIVRLFAEAAGVELPANSQQQFNSALKERADAIAKSAAAPSGQRRSRQREKVSA